MKSVAGTLIIFSKFVECRASFTDTTGSAMYAMSPWTKQTAVLTSMSLPQP